MISWLADTNHVAGMVICVGEERVLMVGATTRPQELDDAARRLVKRLYIPLPDTKARASILARQGSWAGRGTMSVRRR